jgi:hypothetical protein
LGRAIDEVSIVDTMGVKSVLGMQSDHPGESAFLVPIGLCVSAAQGHFLKLDKQLEGGSGRWPPGSRAAQRLACEGKRMASERRAQCQNSVIGPFMRERMVARGKGTTMRTLFLTTAAFAALVMIAPVGKAHADSGDILQRAQERLAQGAADNYEVWQTIQAKECFPGENPVVCNAVAVCFHAPEIAGDGGFDDSEVLAAAKAGTDAGGDLRKQALAFERSKIALAKFDVAARALVTSCEAKVRSAFQHAAAEAQAKTEADRARIGADAVEAARPRLEAEANAKIDAERAQIEADAKAQVRTEIEADLRAKAVADAKAKAEADAKADIEAASRAKDEAAADFKAAEERRLEAEAVARNEAAVRDAKAKTEAAARAKAAEEARIAEQDKAAAEARAAEVARIAEQNRASAAAYAKQVRDTADAAELAKKARAAAFRANALKATNDQLAGSCNQLLRPELRNQIPVSFQESEQLACDMLAERGAQKVLINGTLSYSQFSGH